MLHIYMVEESTSKSGEDMSDVIMMAKRMEGLIEQSDDLPNQHEAYGKEHLYEMVDKIKSGDVGGEKAHRWLGWLQCAICMGGGATLEEIKDETREVVKD